MTVLSPGQPSAARVAAAAQLACLLEVSAAKPGNVSPGRAFEDLRCEDFLASAVAIGRPFEGAGTRPLGQTVRIAIESTREWTRSNTNLGIVLMLAPLARAALTTAADLRSAVRVVLDATTVDDAREVYAAIRLARPGGLGKASAQDIADEPTMTLLEVMRLAADRDNVSREYATGFDLTFSTGVPALTRARADGLHWDEAIVETYLTLLAARPDTHIVRRTGAAAAAEVSRLAHAVLADGGVRTTAGRQAIDDMDRAMRDARNSLNPGTTADLTTAAIFVALLHGGWAQSV
jgi:triphosphoribosyl-dephospho-CoA synthase